TIAAEVEHLQAEICVVGGGPAGLSAAAAAVQAGAQVLLLERQPRLGGRVLWDGHGPDVIEQDLQVLHGSPRVEVKYGTTVFGVYEGSLLGAFCGDRFLKVRARQVIVCTGARQRPFIFHNNDLPGIILADGALRLARLHVVSPGRRAVVMTNHDGGHALAGQLQALGVEVAEVVDVRPGGQLVTGAKGNKRLKGVRVSPTGGGEERTIHCDLLCMDAAPVPANELLMQAGVRFRLTASGWEPATEVAGVVAAGGAAGVFDLEAQQAQGRLRGVEAAAALGHAVADLAARRSAWEASRSRGAVSGGVVMLNTGRKRFVCLCEDVTEKDLEQAVAEGFDHIETLKRYATAGMGPCQGKMCGLNVTEVCAGLTGRDVNATGTTTCRPPVVPVELGVLAAERRYAPVRRTPLHAWHAQAGAVWLDAGAWKRPESYGDPAGEVRAVRTGVGLIDVSTLGKLEVIGLDAAELLERIYLNHWANLSPGRVRYGALCTEEGILFDDGVGVRLGPERFYLTATTGNAEVVYQWLEMWRAMWRLDALVLNHTSALGAMNLAGPCARDVLRSLTDCDLSPQAFPYLACREAQVAGVTCRLMRLGFVGELSYEIHCRACDARNLWDALATAGKDRGLRPFGVEAQRILRLEKGHIILGQDTDALSSPLDAGLGWLVRFDKPQFHGRETLLRLQAMAPRSRLVGFVVPDGVRVPAEGCQVIEAGAPVGRVTSARWSPALDQVIGLAWVPASCSTAGSRFVIRHAGMDVPAVVARLPFHDPEGTRQRM
ncbi:MAG: FAD-dependent oxidoreductase, partial [Gemmataceae bacterium]|nr:FAD-dependent oxidoreductase [Gemmataceae bacterium]